MSHSLVLKTTWRTPCLKAVCKFIEQIHRHKILSVSSFSIETLQLQELFGANMIVARGHFHDAGQHGLKI